MIKFENVCFKYPKFEIKDTSFSIESGEIVAITGGNASGKTTLLNLAAGLIKPKKGKVLVLGEKPACGKNIGMVFQNPENQIIFSTVYEDIAFTLKNHKVPKSEYNNRISEALKNVGLEGFEKHETFSLSAGQKQRLVLANMLATKPKLLLLDEVSVYLDEEAKLELFKLFKNLKSLGITIVFATNVLDEIVYADKVMVLDNGEIKAFKTKQEIIMDLSIYKNIGLHVPIKLELLSILNKSELMFDQDIISELVGRLKWYLHCYFL